MPYNKPVNPLDYLQRLGDKLEKSLQNNSEFDVVEHPLTFHEPVANWDRV